MKDRAAGEEMKRSEQGGNNGGAGEEQECGKINACVREKRKE